MLLPPPATEHKNKLYYGDCLAIMKDMKSECFDLIYLDPPFNSKRDYNAIYKDETGRPLPDQIDAFSDTWPLDEDRERALRNIPVTMREDGIEDEFVNFWSLWMKTLRKTDPSLLAYLSYMTERLLPMKRLLRPTGSIYLHCDPSASHYIKVMMDAIFGHKNFLNEIVWSYRTGGAGKKRFSQKHDNILFYAKSCGDHFFKVVKEKAYTKSKGRRAGSINYGAGRAEFFEDDKGVFNWVNMRDVWDISYVNSRAKERLGYATQKPVALLKRIIEASSDIGDIVFDPFCGCATTIEAAHKLERRWVGIDIAIHAIKRVSKIRLKDRLGLQEGSDYFIEGVPSNLEGARDLWKRDKYHFQKWAVEQVDGFVTSKRTADGGIDGRLYFDLPDRRELASMIIEVKGGQNFSIDVIRNLRGVLERERDGAEMAGLIVMSLPADRQMRNFISEMATAGDLEVHGMLYPRMQILSIEQILKDERFKTPGIARGQGATQPVLSLG